VEESHFLWQQHLSNNNHDATKGGNHLHQVLQFCALIFSTQWIIAAPRSAYLFIKEGC
jgi:hypothetical protein